MTNNQALIQQVQTSSALSPSLKNLILNATPRPRSDYKYTSILRIADKWAKRRRALPNPRIAAWANCYAGFITKWTIAQQCPDIAQQQGLNSYSQDCAQPGFSEFWSQMQSWYHNKPTPLDQPFTHYVAMSESNSTTWENGQLCNILNQLGQNHWPFHVSFGNILLDQSPIHGTCVVISVPEPAAAWFRLCGVGDTAVAAPSTLLTAAQMLASLKASSMGPIVIAPLRHCNRVTLSKIPRIDHAVANITSLTNDYNALT